MTKSLLYWDTRDDRTQLHDLLARLPPFRRVGFVERCCKLAPGKGGLTQPRVKRATWELAKLACREDGADRRLTLEAVMDVFYLASQYDLDLDAALNLLVGANRQDSRRPDHVPLRLSAT